MLRACLCRVITVAVALLMAAENGYCQAQRVLRFPADREVGIVYVCPAERAATATWMYGDKWRRAGEARGELSVPAGVEVRLDVGSAVAQDLAFLELLRPDDLHALSLQSTQLADDGLAHVGRLACLRRLDLNETRITDAGVHHLKELRQMREIHLDAFAVERDGFGVGDASLQMMALGKWNDLETITLRLTKITDAGIGALALLKSLKTVSIPGTAVTDAGAERLARLPRLERLDLGMYEEGSKITDEGLKAVAQMRHLKSLNLGGTAVTDEGLRHLHTLTALESLSIDNTKVTDAGIAHLSPLQKLSTLRAYLTASLSDVGAENLAKLPALTRLTAHLELTERGLEALSHAPLLQNVDLNEDGITDAGLVHLGKMQSLKEIWFQHCPITDAGLAELSRLPNLEYLNLHETKVTSEGLSHLKQLPRFNRLGFNAEFKPGTEMPTATLGAIGELKGLTRLGLGAKIPSEEFKHLQNLPGLVELRVRNDALPLTDEGALHIGGLHALETLELEHTVVTDMGLAHLSCLRNLKSLTLAGHFTPSGLKWLERLRSLSVLQISSPYITQADVQALSASVPSITYLNLFEGESDVLREVTVSKSDGFRRHGNPEQRRSLDVLEGKPPPRLPLHDWIGLAAHPDPSFEQLRRKVVLLYFWKGDHEDAARDLARLKTLFDKHREQGLALVGVHSPEGAGLPDALEKSQLAWPVAADLDDATAEAWSVAAPAIYFLIDRQGQLRIAGVYPPDLEWAARELLAEK